MKACLIVAAIFVAASVGSATTIHVPADSATIQAGINGAVDGDTVLVADGTYAGDGNRDIDFLGKAIMVMSENGPELTIIDCEGSESYPHRGFWFHGGEDSTSILEGFTIKNGWNLYGGGIYCHSSPKIAGNIITSNIASRGGGIYCATQSRAIIESNELTMNTTIELGGGIYCGSSAPRITDNIKQENASYMLSQELLRNEQSIPLIKKNKIINNRSGGDGGGIYCYKSSPIIDGNMIIGNVAEDWGGGIVSYWYSSPRITNNIIAVNISERGGGIFCWWYSSAIILRNIIEGNWVENDGGGIYCYHHSTPIIINNTIVANSANEHGGGIHLAFESLSNITNTVFWNNESNTGKEIFIGGTCSPCTLTISYSDLEGGLSSVYIDTGGALNWGPGMIDDDPLFVLSEKRDFRLLWGSPCIDTGEPDSLDADGTRSDMGAHFFDQDDYLTLYLTPDTTEVEQDSQLGVTYTLINRWNQKEPFWILTQAILPEEELWNVFGPDRYSICARYTVQFLIAHDIPSCANIGKYEYRSVIGLLPSILYDIDKFIFKVVAPDSIVRKFPAGLR